MRRATDGVDREATQVRSPDEVDLGAEDAPAAPPAPQQRVAEQGAPASGAEEDGPPLDGGADPDVPAALSERDCRILDFERKWWRHAGSKEQAIREHFQLSSTRYYQVLNGLLDEPAALEYDPVLIKRLRRLRATRARTRTAGRSR